jgi:hypothetical protein
MRCRRFDAVEHAPEVQTDDPLPFVHRPVVDLGQVARARVVEHGAQPSERRGGVVDRSTKRVVVGDVNGVHEPVDLLGDLLGGVAVHVDDCNAGAFLGHAPARGPPDTGAATGDDRPLTVEESHARLQAEPAS